jgi:cell division protein ZapA
MDSPGAHKREDERKDERKTVRVTIYNQPYTLAVSGESGEVEALAQSVDQLMSDIAHQAGNVDGNRVAVLACLHLADRLRCLEQELSEFRSQVGEKTRRYSFLLDEALR